MDFVEPRDSRCPVDADAYSALFAEHWSAVWRFCRSRSAGEAAADDACQEVFARVAQSGSLSSRPDLPLLLTIARNVCADAARRAAREARALERYQQQSPAVSEPDCEAATIGRMAIRDLLHPLTPLERRVILHRVARDLSFEETARVLGMQADAVRHAFRRGRLKVVQAIGQAGVAAIGPFWTGVNAWFARRGSSHSSAMLTAWDRFLAVAPAVGVAGLVVLAPQATTGGALRSRPAAPTLAAAPRVAAVPAAVPAAFAPVLGYPAPDRVTPATVRAPMAPAAPDRTAATAVRTSSAGADQGRMTATDFQPSPGYGSDHTVLEAGVPAICYGSGCRALFISRDSGRTWTQLPALNFTSDRLILPAAGFAAGRFYGIGGGGLQVTTDGGRTFTPAPAISGYPSAGPAGWPGDVMIANSALWSYTAGQTAPTLLSALPAGTTADGPPAFVDGSALMALAGTGPLGGPDRVGACTASGACRALGMLPWRGRTTLRVSPDYSRDHTIAAYGPGMAVSVDGGVTFRDLSSGWSNVADLQFVTSASGSRLIATAVAAGSGGQARSLIEAAPGAGAWSAANMGSIPAPAVPHLLGFAPGGPAFAVTDPLAGGRELILASYDSGTSWQVLAAI